MSYEQDQARRRYRAKKYVHSESDFPEGDHFAIIEFRSFTVPGDERSRQAPGHGYPEHTETTMSYSVFALEDREVWEEEIARLEKGRERYIALDKGKRVKVEPIFKISITS
jgi:hypothetical protein